MMKAYAHFRNGAVGVDEFIDIIVGAMMGDCGGFIVKWFLMGCLASAESIVRLNRNPKTESEEFSDLEMAGTG